MKLGKLSLGLLAASAIISSAEWSLAAGEVSLLYARSITSTKYGRSAQNATIDILVQNLSYQKDVAAHLRGADGTWSDVSASYLRPADANREVWRITLQRNSWDGNNPLDLLFALRYTVNGQTYWDNNSGQNYAVGADQGSLLVGEDVYVSNAADVAMPYNNTLSGSVTLKNLAYAKQVTVVYTVDGWATTRTAAASYSPYFWYGAYSSASNPNALGAEEWSYTLDVSGGSTLEYAVAYTVNGVTYWDNNFGHNYRTTLQ
ncbi:MAG: carbohydrate-binding protein [Minicystis sp.]